MKVHLTPANQACQNGLGCDGAASRLAAVHVLLRQGSAAKGRMGGPTPG